MLGRSKQDFLFFDFRVVEIVIPLAVCRRLVTAEALGVLVGVPALRAGGCSLEGVPRVATARAEPAGAIARFPRTFWAVDFDFAFGTHVCLDVF